jgi:hypothetical protein
MQFLPNQRRQFQFAKRPFNLGIITARLVKRCRACEEADHGDKQPPAQRDRERGQRGGSVAGVARGSHGSTPGRLRPAGASAKENFALLVIFSAVGSLARIAEQDSDTPEASICGKPAALFRLCRRVLVRHE